jgi:hypothetical protein
MRRTAISTEIMSPVEYVSAIEGTILPYVVDKSMLCKFGLDDVFNTACKVPSNLSYDDACACMDSIEMLLDVLSYVSDRFSTMINEADDDKKITICSADTIRTLFVDATQNIKIEHKERNTDKKTLIDSINTNLEFLPIIKNNTFKTIVYTARSHGLHMIGFTSNV